MPAGGRPTVRSTRLGKALRSHRQAAGIEMDAAAKAIMGSKAKISRMEGGQVSARPLEVALLLTLYGVTDEAERARLDHWARESNKRGWWLDYSVSPGYDHHISLENDATYIRSWDTVLIPGLLQTEAYAAAVINSGPMSIDPEDVLERIKLRRMRQQRIANDNIPQAVILWEPAINTPMGGTETHREQLEHLLELSRRGNVSLQVLRLSSGVMVGMATPFTAFSFGPEMNIETVTVEALNNTHVYEGQDDLTGYGRLFESLRSEAASSSESQKLIQQVLRSKGTSSS